MNEQRGVGLYYYILANLSISSIQMGIKMGSNRIELGVVQFDFLAQYRYHIKDLDKQVFGVMSLVHEHTGYKQEFEQGIRTLGLQGTLRNEQEGQS